MCFPMAENHVFVMGSFLNQVWYKLQDNPILLFGLALVLALGFNVLAYFDLTLAFLYCGAFLGLMILVIFYMRPYYAMVTFLISGFLIFFIFYRVLRINSIPLGIMLDALNAFTLIALFLKRDLRGTKTLTGTLLMVWFCICLIEVINPFAASRAAWFHAMRHVFNYISPFFIIYSLFKAGYKILKPLLLLWIGLCTLSALYTFYQEFAGLPPWDFRYMHVDEHRVKLFTTFGRIRKFSFVGNPTENGLLLFSNTLLCMGLAVTDGLKKRYVSLFILLATINGLAMTYTGTRTATILFIIGVGLFVVLRRKKELWMGVLVISFLLVGYVAKTGGGGAMSVMTTAFNDDDPSLQARFHNQQVLRKFLYRSPIGYGMGSTGYLGKKYSPYTVLASIPPDSELVRIIVEVGFLGAAFYLFMQYKFISRAVENLSEPGDDFTQNFRVVVIALLFTILLGHYPQQIMIINPMKIFVGTLLAYINLTPEEAQLQSWLSSKNKKG